jgi:hypothetical protein
MQYLYPKFLDAKLWLKTKTPVGRLANLSTLELDDPEDLEPSDPSEGTPAERLPAEDQTARSIVRD